MSSNNHIVLLDPELGDHTGAPSANLGDLIISESNLRLLEGLFSGIPVIRISTHSFLTRQHRQLINSASFCFLGGTNLLHSDMLGPRIFMIREGRLLWLFPGIKNLVLLGTGWGYGYEKQVTLRTKILYKNILHKGYIHSVRDSFTGTKLAAATGRKTINTACVSMWSLDGICTNLQKTPQQCLFTLTDYSRNETTDTALVSLLLSRFSKLTFFPQGSDDKVYFTSLEVYKKNKPQIEKRAAEYRFVLLIEG